MGGRTGESFPSSVSVSTRPFLSWFRVDVCLQLDILVGEAEAELHTFKDFFSYGRRLISLQLVYRLNKDVGFVTPTLIFSYFVYIIGA